MYIAYQFDYDDVLVILGTIPDEQIELAKELATQLKWTHEVHFKEIDNYNFVEFMQRCIEVNEQKKAEYQELMNLLNTSNKRISQLKVLLDHNKSNDSLF